MILNGEVNILLDRLSLGELSLVSFAFLASFVQIMRFLGNSFILNLITPLKPAYLLTQLDFFRILKKPWTCIGKYCSELSFQDYSFIKLFTKESHLSVWLVRLKKG
jgi:hypothetical protein